MDGDILIVDSIIIDSNSWISKIYGDEKLGKSRTDKDKDKDKDI